jgi:hypothetical protein
MVTGFYVIRDIREMKPRRLWSAIAIAYKSPVYGHGKNELSLLSMTPRSGDEYSEDIAFIKDKLEAIEKRQERTLSRDEFNTKNELLTAALEKKIDVGCANLDKKIDIVIILAFVILLGQNFDKLAALMPLFK